MFLMFRSITSNPAFFVCVSSCLSWVGEPDFACSVDSHTSPWRSLVSCGVQRFRQQWGFSEMFHAFFFSSFKFWPSIQGDWGRLWIVISLWRSQKVQKMVYPNYFFQGNLGRFWYFDVPIGPGEKNTRLQGLCQNCVFSILTWFRGVWECLFECVGAR